MRGKFIIFKGLNLCPYEGRLLGKVAIYRGPLYKRERAVGWLVSALGVHLMTLDQWINDRSH